MAYFSTTANVKSGVNARNNFNLSFHHITTQEISRLQPIFKRAMVPGDKFRVSTQSFHRLAPLPVPTYGNLKSVTRAFFVPCRILMFGFENVITQTSLQTSSGLVRPIIPRFTNDAFIGMFTVVSNGLAETFSGTDDTCDFYIVASGTTKTYYRFTTKGKLWYNLFVSLGYGFNWTSTDTTPMSLLPLLAYMRIYLDWYMPTQYEPSDPLYPFLTNWNVNLNTPGPLYNFCSTCLNFYEKIEKDFFTCAWPSPSGPVGLNPINITNSRLGISDTGRSATVSNSGLSGYVNSPQIGITQAEGIRQLSQYGLNVLSAVQNYVNRDMIAGNRYIEQMFARYGVKVPDSWLRRSEYLGSNSDPVQISDVMANSSSEFNQLGDYAGKGISINNGSFEYEAKEFGYFIVLNCIICETGYTQGRDKENLHLEPLDFFTPEFDQIGAAPIRNDELLTGYKSTEQYSAGLSYGSKADGVFGFSEQYYEYKNSRDMLTGDFAISSRNQLADSYHLFRKLQFATSSRPLALNLAFMSGDPNNVNNQFNRIFQQTSSFNDHFMSEHFIKVHASRPMHSSADSLVTEGGRELEMSFNGYQL